MTDNEIIKALECCKDPECANCKECPAYETHKDCMGCVLSEAIDLINRQRAEIERLKCDNSNIHRLFSDACKRKKAEDFSLATYGKLYQANNFCFLSVL